MTNKIQMTNDEWHFDVRIAIRHSSFVILFCLLLACSLGARAAETNSLVWNKAADRVDADIHGEPLWPLLEDIAHQTGWHIFVEPGTARVASTKFKELAPDDALRMLLGNLNFAFVPQTNGPDFLYVFTTSRENATQPVWPEKPVVKKQRHVANELIVKLKPGANIDALAKLLGAKILARLDKLGIYRLGFPDAAATDAALAKLQGNSDVAAADYNYIFDPPPAPQLYSGTASAPPKLIADVSNQGDPCNPVVALIDTAYQPSGTSLDQFALPPISVTGEDCPPASGITHATAMYQTILNAVAQSSGGHSSVKILPINVFGCDGTANTWIVVMGMLAAATNGATVFNMSLGGISDSAVLHDVANQLLAQGVVIYAAAGNQPVNTPTFPAAYSGVNAVTALGAPGQLASYANYGSFVSLALPGASVVFFGNQSYVVQGTSPATAYATGMAAGTKGLNCPSWAQIQAAMQQKFPVPQK
jgi:thermitase